MSLLESTPQEAELRHLLGKTLDAHRGGYDAWCCQSTGEKLAVAMVLNKPEWLAEMNYTIPEALERIGPTWVGLLRLAERTIATHGGSQA